jgi:hypothetical protein
MRSSLGLSFVVSRHLRPWNILELHRDFPFGVNAERGELPLGVASSLVVLFQADEKFAGDGIQIDRFQSRIASRVSFAAEDRAKSIRANPKRRFNSVFVAPDDDAMNVGQAPKQRPDFSQYDGPGQT